MRVSANARVYRRLYVQTNIYKRIKLTTDQAGHMWIDGNHITLHLVEVTNESFESKFRGSAAKSALNKLYFRCSLMAVIYHDYDEVACEKINLSCWFDI
jgi:hypothetical protein